MLMRQQPNDFPSSVPAVVSLLRVLSLASKFCVSPNVTAFCVRLPR